MIYNEPAKVINRPLMEALFKLCNNYQDRLGITIGNMFAEVEKQKHTDENINAFLRYKANNIKSQRQALYPEDDTVINKDSADSSANKKGWVSWFSHCSQKAVNCAQRIVRGVPSIASKTMYTSAFSELMVSPVGAVNDKFTCDDNGEILRKDVCNGHNDCRDRSDESVFTCCKGGESGVNNGTRFCLKNDDSGGDIFVCDDASRQTILKEKRCDGIVDCADGIDENVSVCCQDGEERINNATRICLKQGGAGEELFVCYDNMQTIVKDWRCDGYADCKDESDEKVGGINPTCFHCDDGNNGVLILGELRCNRNNDCADDSDEKINGTNPTCFHCDNETLIFGELRCNGNNDCFDGSDESWSCPTSDAAFTDAAFTDATSIKAGMLGTGVIALGAYVVMLVKYRDKKSTKGAFAWLASPITEPVRYLRRHCAYYLAPQRENNGGANRNSYCDMRSCAEVIMRPFNYLRSCCGRSPVSTEGDEEVGKFDDIYKNTNRGF